MSFDVMFGETKKMYNRSTSILGEKNNDCISHHCRTGHQAILSGWLMMEVFAFLIVRAMHEAGASEFVSVAEVDGRWRY